MSMHKAFHPINVIDSMYQEKKKDEDSTTLRIASIHHCKDSRAALNRINKELLQQRVTAYQPKDKQKNKKS